MKVKSTLLSRFTMACMLLLFLPTVVLAASYEVSSVKTYSAPMKAGQPLDVGLEVKGVKLESIFFDQNQEALLILWNKTPTKVRPEIGVALFDNKGRLLATGYRTKRVGAQMIRPGKQKNYRLKFDKFIEDYTKVAKFQLVFSLINKVSKE